MRFRRTAWMVVVAVAWLTGGAEAAEKGADLFRAGETRLAAGDLQGALQQFAGAVRADPANQRYTQQYAMLRQVLMMRVSLPKESVPSQWAYKARALHTFYVNHGLYAHALEIGEQLHAKLDNGVSALLLAETQLAMNQPADAAQVLADLPAAKHTVATKALQGLAVARQGKPDEARQIAQTIQLTSDEGAGAVYAVARLHAAIGDDTQACQLLVRCFESALPSRAAGFKQHAQTSPEFSSLAADTRFVAALQTASKVPESACSGGSSCASCPMRGNCASGEN
jgi:hypothetical protein